MKKIDFLIRYEHKVRELESIMLIRTELERRGYTVAFEANYEYKKVELHNPKVLIIPSLYSDANIMRDLAKYGLKKKIANLLWEQLIGQRDEDSPNCSHNVVGLGQKAITFCWGRRIKDRIVKGGVPDANAKIVGQLNTDLLRPAFVNSLNKKDELACQFNLDTNKKWVLFISSFAYSELDDIQVNLFLKEYGHDNFNYMVNLSNGSRAIILQWFESVLIEHPNDIIIYRPHPDEARKSKILKDMESKYPNFRVISELALKHWLNAADKVYNWYSTGLVDAVILRKPFRLLRPIKIRREDDYKIYYDAKQIQTEKEFLADYEDLSHQNIIDRELFNSYYYIPERFVYQKVCDILQDMIETNKYDVRYSFMEYCKFGYARMHYVIRHFYIIDYMIRKLSFIPFIKKRIINSEKRKNILKDGYDKNVASQTDIDEIYSRIKPVIYGQKV